jgi:hypothetical protein
MDAKNEVLRLTDPHLNWFYGPFSKQKPPPLMPKNGDWVMVVYGALNVNVGQFRDTGALGDCFSYHTASCGLVDLWQDVAGYAVLPPFDVEKLKSVGEPTIPPGMSLRQAIERGIVTNVGRHGR